MVDDLVCAWNIAPTDLLFFCPRSNLPLIGEEVALRRGQQLAGMGILQGIDGAVTGYLRLNVQIINALRHPNRIISQRLAILSWYGIACRLQGHVCIWRLRPARELMGEKRIILVRACQHAGTFRQRDITIQHWTIQRHHLIQRHLSDAVSQLVSSSQQGLTKGSIAGSTDSSSALAGVKKRVRLTDFLLGDGFHTVAGR